MTTATPVSEALVTEIKSRLQASRQTDDVIELTTVVDPDLIGGFIVEFDNKRYDASLMHKLELLRKEFNKNQYIKNF